MKHILVAVKGDTTVEPNETFSVNLSNPVGATLADALADRQGLGTILNDDTSVAQAVPYSQNFSRGLPTRSSGWEYYSTGEGRIAVASGQLRMDDKKQTEVPVSRVQTKRLRALLKL